MATSLKGQLLVASPKLKDPNFFRAVVLIVQHGKQGAMGLVLHRPIDVSVATAWSQVSQAPCAIDGALHRGGPCEGVLMALHDDPSASDQNVADGIHFSTARASIEQIVSIARPNVRLFVGYAGWAEGQLENELAEGAWLTIDATPQRVYDADVGAWPALVKAIDRASLSQWLDERIVPEDPSMN